MIVLGKELESGTDLSATEFRDGLITELEKCLEVPFAMNDYSQTLQQGQQKALKQIIEYLKWVI